MSTPTVAIVGSGPSGCYLAQALRKQWPQSEICIIDRLPVPYGLVRYGVAPDHPGTKGVTRQFERLFTREGIRFVGHLQIGRDIGLEQLRETFDIVVLATGLYGDRQLGIPGESLPGVFRSGPLTRLFNDHPDEQGGEYEMGERCVIVGNGNVAIDLLRLLSKPVDAFGGSELSDRALSRVHRDRLKRIDIVGRSPLHSAKFDTVMLKELAELGGIRFFAEIADAAGGTDAQEEARREVLNTLVNGSAAVSDGVEVHFHFGWSPTAILGESRVAGVEFSRGVDSEARLQLDADSLITAVGFAADPKRDFDRDALSGSQADAAAGRLDRGLYCTGWFKRGPRGTIAENRADSRQVASTILADFDQQSSSKPGFAALPEAVTSRTTDYAGWLKIDAVETAAAPEGRLRRKLVDLPRMLTIAQTGETGEINS